MSLNTLAREALERPPARSTVVTPGPGPSTGTGAPPTTDAPSREDVLSGIAKYIPTEIVTLFLFALSLQTEAKTGVSNWITVKNIYWFLLLFTIPCFWLIFAAKWRAQNANAWPTWRDFPVWSCIAAVIGFAVWGPAVPKSGLLDPAWSPWIALAALLVSTVFSLVERAFKT